MLGAYTGIAMKVFRGILKTSFRKNMFLILSLVTTEMLVANCAF